MSTLRRYLLTFVVVNHVLACVECMSYQPRYTCDQGDCICITSCTEAMTRIQSGNTNYPKICGWFGRIPMVCCKREIPTEIQLDLEEKSARIDDISISPEGCGVRILPNYAPYVFGGYDATFKWPWMAAIYNGNKNTQLCGGAVIDDRHILTAAHCFAGKKIDPKIYSVQVGVLVISDTNKYYDVQEIKIHEGYRERFDYDDIAILRLVKPLPNDMVPVCISNSDSLREGDNVTVLGWGDLSYGGPTSKKLQEIDFLPIVENRKCNEKFQSLARARFPRGIWPKFLCAGLEKGGKDACQGDSGGPLLHQDSTGIWSLVGIISFGYKCGEPGYPGVYTKVSAYNKWIAEYIGNQNEVSMELSKQSDFDYVDARF